jgi:hypothetical protein
MKDSIALLVTGVIVAALSWAFWHYAGENASSIFSAVIIMALWLDNIRMRKLLRKRPSDQT